MNKFKWVGVGMVLILTVCIILIGWERGAFFQGHPIMPMEERAIKEINDGSLAHECKAKRGNNAVLEVLIIDSNNTFARCGLFLPFSNSYVLKNK